jgi:hypothetical protein
LAKTPAYDLVIDDGQTFSPPIGLMLKTFRTESAPAEGRGASSDGALG